MSVSRSWSGPSAWKLLFTRSSGAGATSPTQLVHLRFPFAYPTSIRSSLIGLLTTFSDTKAPRLLEDAHMRGDPQARPLLQEMSSISFRASAYLSGLFAMLGA